MVVGIAEESQVPLISCAASYKIVNPIESRKWCLKSRARIITSRGRCTTT